MSLMLQGTKPGQDTAASRTGV
uniref:Uncharacterized protein n=1 Tax=Anguilla anguilla TaxID=7936 RepID=A0A0E9Q7N9_ANGAN